MLDIKKQIGSLYALSVLKNLSLTGAWVALLAARGFSLLEIGLGETVFHITSLLFEVPSGVLADVFGRKRLLLASTAAQAVGSLLMIFSTGLPSVCCALAFFALSYNFASGTEDALAYDSLKRAGAAARFERFESAELIIYRVCGGVSALSAGLALLVGYRLAYATDLLACAAQVMVLLSLREVRAEDAPQAGPIRAQLLSCFRESFRFLRGMQKALGLMLSNALVGAADTLLLFFLQAKLLDKGIPGWALGPALLFMELGGVLGARLILRFPHRRFRWVFGVTLFAVLAGVLLEHAPLYPLAALGGFLSAAADDALQVRTNAKLQTMFPSEQRATLTSVESFAFSVVMIVLTPLMGLLFTYW